MSLRNNHKVRHQVTRFEVGFLQFIHNNLHQITRFHLSLRAAHDVIVKAGACSIWLAGHYLGSPIALMIGREIQMMFLKSTMTKIQTTMNYSEPPLPCPAPTSGRHSPCHSQNTDSFSPTAENSDAGVQIVESFSNATLTFNQSPKHDGWRLVGRSRGEGAWRRLVEMCGGVGWSLGGWQELIGRR